MTRVLTVPTLLGVHGLGGRRGRSMRIPGVVLLAVMAGGCSTVKLEQRDGCWVRQTSHWPSAVTEELGPCEREKPAWSEDRLTRLVQECMVQADYRWRTRAVAAWNEGQPLPEPESEERMLQLCMDEAAHSVVTENERLKTRLEEVSTDRDVWRASGEKDRELMRASHERLTDALGEAAKKPPGAAVATATSTSTSRGDGTATTRNESDTTIPAPPVRRVPAPKLMRACTPRKQAAAPRPDVCDEKQDVPEVQPATTTSAPSEPLSDEQRKDSPED